MKYNVNIWIILLILIALFICIVIPNNTESKKDKVCEPHANTGKIKETGIGERLENKNIYIEEADEGIYNQLEGRTVNESIKILEKHGNLARQIIPDFPLFPKSCVLKPTNKGKYASLGERYCMEFMEILFPGSEFKKVRPTWLKNPKTNRCLELDGFCDDLMIAVEYNGIQHYSWPNFTGCSQQDFLKQRYRDQIKEEICISKNICLIRIPYTVSLDRIPLAIYSKLLDGVPGLRPGYFTI